MEDMEDIVLRIVRCKVWAKGARVHLRFEGTDGDKPASVETTLAPDEAARLVVAIQGAIVVAERVEDAP